MNTLNYIGCKKTLLNTIVHIIKTNISDLSNREFADLFAGTGIVGFTFNSLCKKVISNDLEYYSFIIINGLLKCKYSTKLEKLINELNQLELVKD